MQRFHPVPLEYVQLEGGLLGERQSVNRHATLPAIYRQLQLHGHLKAWKRKWQPAAPPHFFWDSDLAKWMEAVGYALALQRDEQLEAWMDEIIDDMQRLQLPDGYLNSHFINLEADKRWSNLRDNHELYCAGHLMEAAVAYTHATGKSKFLDIIRRYADHIDTVFGPLPGQKCGYPGHPEIELALIRLYHATGEQRYLRLSRFFIEERGRQPHYYDLEALARGEDPLSFWGKTYAYMQAHVPVRQQHQPVGHVVRAAYLYCAMADLAYLDSDVELLEGCQTLFQVITNRLSYITGGVGSSAANEGFTYDYDLPDESAYAETCSGIGIFLLAHRLLQHEGDAQYADTMERILYNNFLSAMSLDGTRFMYVNPLAVHREAGHINSQPLTGVLTGNREVWFSCACCPPNIARLLGSLGNYCFSPSGNTLLVHLFNQGCATLQMEDGKMVLRQVTDYPWNGLVPFEVGSEEGLHFTLGLRKPGWCRNPQFRLNGEPISPLLEKGYFYIERTWQPGDRLEYEMPMPIERNYAHPRVRSAPRRTALSRGPLVYCLESADNGENLSGLYLAADIRLQAVWEPQLLGGTMTLQGDAQRAREDDWGRDLYRTRPPTLAPAQIKAIPYFTWNNRGEGDMRIWIPEV